ncbi:MAG: DUF5982 domain-containing protein [Kofleriaceae bacterium]
MRMVLAMLVVAVISARADRLSPDDLARKNVGGYVTGLPLFAYSTDIGFGIGARAYYYWNGQRDDDRFPRTPYLHRVFVQGFASTRGLQFHWIDYDAPAVLGTPFRLRSQLILQRNINQNYFGLGRASLAPLAFPGAAGTFDRYADYEAAQRRVTDGTTWGKYDQYSLLRPIAIASVERVFLGDRLHVLGGVGITWARIDDYTGDQVDAIAADGTDTTATMGTTRLRSDCDLGRLVGCDGGRDNYLRFGVAYDTRDFEPDPNRAVYGELAIDIGTRALASEYEYVRMLAVARGYWSPLGDRADLVLAVRGLFQVTSQGVPLFGTNTLPFLEDPRAGLGGHRTLRGHRLLRQLRPPVLIARAGRREREAIAFEHEALPRAAVRAPGRDLADEAAGRRRTRRTLARRPEIDRIPCVIAKLAAVRRDVEIDRRAEGGVQVRHIGVELTRRQPADAPLHRVVTDVPVRHRRGHRAIRDTVDVELRATDRDVPRREHVNPAGGGRVAGGGLHVEQRRRGAALEQEPEPIARGAKYAADAGELRDTQHLLLAIARVELEPRRVRAAWRALGVSQAAGPQVVVGCGLEPDRDRVIAGRCIWAGVGRDRGVRRIAHRAGRIEPDAARDQQADGRVEDPIRRHVGFQQGTRASPRAGGDSHPP